MAALKESGPAPYPCQACIRISTGCAMDQADGGPRLALPGSLYHRIRRWKRRLWSARMTTVLSLSLSLLLVIRMGDHFSLKEKTSFLRWIERDN